MRCPSLTPFRRTVRSKSSNQFSNPPDRALPLEKNFSRLGLLRNFLARFLYDGWRLLLLLLVAAFMLWWLFAGVTFRRRLWSSRLVTRLCGGPLDSGSSVLFATVRWLLLVFLVLWWSSRFGGSSVFAPQR